MEALVVVSGGLGLISSGASEEPERAWFTRYKCVGESEGPQASAVLPRRGKTNVPARNSPGQTATANLSEKIVIAEGL